MFIAFTKPMPIERGPILTGTIHEAYRERSKWKNREDEFTGRTGLPLLRGEDAFPVCEVLDLADDVRVTVLAVADGVGSGHSGDYKRFHGWDHDGQLHGVTSPRLAAELAISGIPNLVAQLSPQNFKIAPRVFKNVFLASLRNYWRQQSLAYADSPVIMGTSIENIRKSNKFSYFGHDYIFASTTVSLILGVENNKGTKIHIFKWGDSPVILSVGEHVFYSADLIKNGHLLSSYVCFGAQMTFGQYTWAKEVDVSVGYCDVQGDGPVILSTFSDAHAFEDEQDVINNWSHQFKSGFDGLEDVQQCLSQQRRAGDRFGMLGDDLSGSMAVLRPGRLVEGEPIFDKI